PSSAATELASPACRLLHGRPAGGPVFPYTTLFRPPASARSVARAQSASSGRAAKAARWPSTAGSGGPFALATASSDASARAARRSEEHTSELQSRENLVCRLLLEKNNYHSVHQDRL